MGCDFSTRKSSAEKEKESVLLLSNRKLELEEKQETISKRIQTLETRIRNIQLDCKKMIPDKNKPTIRLKLINRVKLKKSIENQLKIFYDLSNAIDNAILMMEGTVITSLTLTTLRDCVSSLKRIKIKDYHQIMDDLAEITDDNLEISETLSSGLSIVELDESELEAELNEIGNEIGNISDATQSHSANPISYSSREKPREPDSQVLSPSSYSVDSTHHRLEMDLNERKKVNPDVKTRERIKRSVEEALT